MQRSGFVSVINGGRDGYQVPQALREAGLLRRHVTEFYPPDNPPRWWPRFLTRRRNPHLPSAEVVQSPLNFLLQRTAMAAGLPMGPVFARTDAMLGRTGLRAANRFGANLYCYAGYVPPAAAIPADMKVIDFEFHPLPGLTLEMLAADAAAYPEVAQSFAAERRQLSDARVTDSWRRADAIVCASAMTARSLVHAGCDPGAITVVPYGFEPGAAAAPRSAEGPARFLFVGQGVQRKGLHHLLHAWRAIDPADAVLTVVCYQIDPGIAPLADQSGVTLLPRQPRAALDALMRSADVFIMPSLVEGFGLSYLEALAAGCHVVGTANTGLPDLPLNDAALSLVEPGDVTGIVAAIGDLIARRNAGNLDPQAIADQAGAWTWADFRRRIAEHAAAVLSD